MEVIVVVVVVAVIVEVDIAVIVLVGIPIFSLEARLNLSSNLGSNLSRLNIHSNSSTEGVAVAVDSSSRRVYWV